jgi:hypothetical protein
MKALTLYQPWATLVAIGAKKIETRSWSTNYRGPLAIHAGKHWMDEDFLYIEPFASCLHNIKIPFGFVVATCELASVIRIGQASYTWASQKWVLNDQEHAFGDYSTGRYMWLLDKVKILTEPIPAKGAMRLWEWDGAQ